MLEIWSSFVPGYEGYYEVSNQGRVRSVARTIVRKDGSLCQIKERILRPGVCNNAGGKRQGYLYVGLSKDGQQTNFLVHRLVAQAFLPNPLGLPEVNHRDGDKTNNFAASNLEWVSRRQNVEHAKNTGLYLAGENAPWSKLTAADVAWIRSADLTNKEIARHLGVCTTTVSHVRTGRNWRRA